MAKQEAAKKTGKTPKVPGMFKKSYTEKQFNKKILKSLYIKEYRDFILQVFNKDNAGNYTIKAEFTKPELKKLKIIARSIARNRGLIQTGKLILLAVIVVAVIGFNLLFKDALFERTAENWLENIFAARAELNQLRFRPEQGRISFASLAVADSDRPFKNLFELGKTEVYLNLAALLKGRVVIRNVECREIRWNTDRKTSGALARQAAAVRKEPEPGSQAAADKKEEPAQKAPAFTFDAAALDITSLLKEQQDKLLSLKQIEESGNTVKSLYTKWQGITDGYGKELETTAATVKTITGLRFQDIKSPAEVQTIYTQATGIIDNVQALSTRITGTKEEFNRDLAAVQELQTKITAAVAADYENLKALIQLPDTEKQALFADLADGYLEEKLGPLYTYGVKAVDFIRKIKPASKQEKAVQSASRGVDVYFPAVQYPQFLLQQAAFSIGDEAAGNFLGLTIKNISSDPELTAAPVSFNLKNVTGGQELVLDGLIDSREGAALPLKLDFQAVNIPFAVNELPAALGITAFTSRFAFNTDAALDKAGTLSGKLILVLEDIKLQTAAATNLITREIGKILSSISEIKVRGDYSITSDKRFEFVIDSNVDNIIQERVGRLIQDTVNRAREQVKAGLDSFIGDKLKDNARLYAAYREIGKLLDGDLTDANNYRKLLETKKQELEKLQQQFIDQARQAAEEQAAKLKKEATDKINSQVDNLKNKLKF